MAATETASLKIPILDAESIDENDVHEVERNGKATPVKELVSDGVFKAKGEKANAAEEIKSSNSVSNSVLKTAASQKMQGLKNIPSDISLQTAQNQASLSENTASISPGSNATKESEKASVGQGWVSFEEEEAKKTQAGVALVTNTQRTEGTPHVVNGAVDKVLTGNSLENSKASQLSPQPGQISGNTTGTKIGTVEINKGDHSAARNDGVSDQVGQSKAEQASGWVLFDDATRTSQTNSRLSTSTSSSLSIRVSESQSSVKSQPSPAVSGSTTPQPSWVTFDESKSDAVAKKSTPDTPVLEGLSVNVTIANQTMEAPSTPSPNPFINAPMSVNLKHASNPFQDASPLSIVTTTNPFHANGPEAVPVTGVPAPLNTTSVTPDWATAPVYHDVSLLEKSLIKSSEVAALPPTPVKLATPPMTSTTRDQIDRGAAAMVSEEKPAILIAEEEYEELDDFDLSTYETSWSMLLRYPDKKKRIGSRNWKAVVIKLDGNTLQIYEEYELSAPFREIPLQACFNFQELRLQEERHSKVHTSKLEYLKYKEIRSVRHKGTIEHISEGTPIIKIGSTSNKVMVDFIEAVSDAIRTLPAYRDRGITYRKDEVFVDVDDTCHALLDGDGNVKKQGGRVQVKLRAFVTGDPECQLVLNDIIVKEREEARLRGELKPQRVHHWIKLHHCQFHKCVDVNAYNRSHAITFHPLDACTFELMRFQAELKKPLPLSVKTSITLHSEQRIELRAEIQLCQETKMAKYVRNNVVFRLPIPETWVPLFKTGKLFGREKAIKSSKGKRAAGIKSRLKHSSCSIAASLGTAKYEQEHSAVVWRVGSLPLIDSKVPVDAPQTLTCVLELPSGMEFPDNYQPHAEVEYDVSHVLLSDTTVIAVKVSNKNIPEKWVCYRAFYSYHIEVTVSRGSSAPIRDVGCTQQ